MEWKWVSAWETDENSKNYIAIFFSDGANANYGCAVLVAFTHGKVTRMGPGLGILLLAAGSWSLAPCLHAALQLPNHLGVLDQYFATPNNVLEL